MVGVGARANGQRTPAQRKKIKNNNKNDGKAEPAKDEIPRTPREPRSARAACVTFRSEHRSHLLACASDSTLRNDKQTPPYSMTCILQRALYTNVTTWTPTSTAVKTEKSPTFDLLGARVLRANRGHHPVPPAGRRRLLDTWDRGRQNRHRLHGAAGRGTPESFR